jgi:hypothetical protein
MNTVKCGFGIPLVFVKKEAREKWCECAMVHHAKHDGKRWDHALTVQ